jgi:hypothetical protein
MSGTNILSVTNTIGLSLFKLGFQISPIILTGGVATYISGGMLPVVALTQGASFALSLLSGSVDDTLDLDSYFAHFEPAPGADLINTQLGQYPFANQSIAANATIAQPLHVSMMMKLPGQSAGAYTQKFVIMGALQTVLVKHRQMGGTYTVLTPTYLYTNCILLRLRDASGGGSKQPQNTWVWDFEQPLITQAAAQAAQNALMQQVTNQTPITGQPATSGPGLATSQFQAPGGGGFGQTNLTATSVGIPPSSTGVSP